ncbi:MAG: glycosyltransferase family 2 protein [Anaerolineae bacterium]|nr:glycosyltransferase family 2 protein [Anaerolineae bacterium]
MDLSVVIPLYNEQGNVRPLVSRLVEALSKLSLSWEVIIVDDGSTDGSFEALRELAAGEPRLRVLRFRRNFGQTAAFAAGFEAAQGQIVVTMDADLQNDPADIPALLDKMAEGYDIVSGWRVNRQDAFLTRRLPSQIANRLAGWLTRVHLHDYGCSLKAYRLEVIRGIRLYGELHRFIPALASWMGVRIAEIPVNHEPRRSGRSKYGLGRTVRVLLDLLTLQFLLFYGTRPAHVFGSLGLVSFGLGAVMSLYLAYVKLILGQSIGSRPLLTLSVLLVIVGVQMVTMGFLGEIMVRTYHEAAGKPIYVVRETLNDPRRGAPD